MKHLLLIFCMAGVALSCTNKEQKGRPSEAKALYDESMKIHDEIMPRMDELFKLRQQLAHQVDSLKSDSTANATPIQERRAAIDRLARADKSMMDWMHQIKDVPGAGAADGANHHDGHHAAPQENLAEEDMLKIQKQQKEEIEKVRKDMEESIAGARTLLTRK